MANRNKHSFIQKAVFFQVEFQKNNDKWILKRTVLGKQTYSQKKKKDKKREMNYCNYLEDDFRGDFSPEDNFSQSSDEFSSERK
jgi:hypothetical protein